MSGDRAAAFFSPREETFNSITHGIGALLSVAAFVALLVISVARGDVLAGVTFSVYGFTLVLLYTSSFLYHKEAGGKRKRSLRILDHISIYLLIAGSYTPIALMVLGGIWGWMLLAAAWLLALVGIALAFGKSAKTQAWSMALYFLMGWMMVVAAKPMVQAAPVGFLLLILVGGLLYTGGMVFYAVNRIPYHHGIWHLFVMAGSLTHFIGFLVYVA